MFMKLSPLFLFTCLLAPPLQADMVHIPADRDATLIEFNAGETANGSGPSFYAGRTNQANFGIRRGLVRFQVAGALPENALIDHVSLTLYQSSGNADEGAFGLHRVLSDWGEGTSIATGGSGARVENNDATWLHTFYDYDYWVQQGGHFVPYASATAMVRGKGFYTWESTVNMENNVRFWLHAPEHNFGWLVMGDEDTPGSVKSFYSRECPDAAVDVKYKCANSDQRPMLTIEYHLPGE